MSRRVREEDGKASHSNNILRGHVQKKVTESSDRWEHRRSNVRDDPIRTKVFFVFNVKIPSNPILTAYPPEAGR